MNIAFFIYLANVLPNLGVLLLIIGLLGSVVAGIVATLLLDAYDVGKHWAIWRKSVAAIAVCFVFAVLIPSERTMYLMAGASVVQKAIESPDMQAINSKVLAIINGKLDEYVSKEKK